MNAKSENLVTEFLLSSIPTQVLDAYEIVSQLTYSVDDKHSLSVQLDKLAKQLKEPADKDTLAIALVRLTFDAGDFPIQSVRGGLEKLHSKLSGRFAFNIPPQHELPFRPDPEDHGEAPQIDMFAVYKTRLHGDECAASCAFAHYNWYLAHPDSRFESGEVRDFYAFLGGLGAGEDCQRTGFCPGFPGPRNPRPLFGCLGVTLPPSPFVPPPVPPFR
jgi:hypothetical protein